MHCIKCYTHIQKNNANLKYCADCRIHAYKENTAMSQRRYRKRKLLATAQDPSPDKIPCYICGLHFKRPMRHVNQAHDMTAYAYKKMFGMYTTKGQITQKARQHLSEIARNNYSTVIQVNLLEKGKRTRYPQANTGKNGTNNIKD